jgi:hypothetical protein
MVGVRIRGSTATTSTRSPSGEITDFVYFAAATATAAIETTTTTTTSASHRVLLPGEIAAASTTLAECASRANPTC